MDGGMQVEVSVACIRVFARSCTYQRLEYVGIGRQVCACLDIWSCVTTGRKLSPCWGVGAVKRYAYVCGYVCRRWHMYRV